MTANSLRSGNNMGKEQITKPLSGWWVFAAFAAFFGVVIAVNTVFITNALRSHSGLVTEDAYKKGLDYNETLKEARSQPELFSKVSFENGVVRWVLKEPSGKPIEDAKVSAQFARPVKDGDDFSAIMRYEGDGLYSLKPDFPVKGAWQLHLSAAWDNKTYKTTNQIIAK